MTLSRPIQLVLASAMSAAVIAALLFDAPVMDVLAGILTGTGILLYKRRKRSK